MVSRRMKRGIYIYVGCDGAIASVMLLILRRCVLFEFGALPRVCCMVFSNGDWRYIFSWKPFSWVDWICPLHCISVCHISTLSQAFC